VKASVLSSPVLKKFLVTQTTEGELQLVQWARPFLWWENKVKMTTVLNKELQDRVTLHSFQMTKVTIISQVSCLGTGICVVYKSDKYSWGSGCFWMWVLSFGGWGQSKYSKVKFSSRKCLKVTHYVTPPLSSHTLSSLIMVLFQGYFVCLFLSAVVLNKSDCLLEKYQNSLTVLRELESK
jgi:hypothetical protein